MVPYFFSTSEPGLFKSLYNELTLRDEYFLMADFESYFRAHEQAMQAYMDKKTLDPNVDF